MNRPPSLYLSVAPVPDANALPALLDRLWADFPLSENENYFRALAGENSPHRPSHVMQERVGALSLLSPLLRRMGVEPATQALHRDAEGRPFLVGEDGIRSVDFNLSHTRTCVACACVPTPYRVGVDAEDIVPSDRAERFITRFCTAGERNMLASVFPFAHVPLIPPRADFVPDFTCLWTIREAVSKYIGQGKPLRFDAAAPPPGIRLWEGHLPGCGTRLSLCVSGDIRTPVSFGEGDGLLSPVTDFDLLITEPIEPTKKG